MLTYEDYEDVIKAKKAVDLIFDDVLLSAVTDGDSDLIDTCESACILAITGYNALITDLLSIYDRETVPAKLSLGVSKSGHYFLSEIPRSLSA